MALNGLHLLGLLESPDLVDEDIPEQLRNDWRGLVREYQEMQEEDKELARKKVCRSVRIRIGKPDPYPELAEAEPEPVEP